jgi:hypothetical protein
MMGGKWWAAAAIVVVLPIEQADCRSSLSDAQIRQHILSASIAEYPGRCPCPYNSTSNGSSCGGRSAWSRRGGYAPLCYSNDVSDAQVNAYRKLIKAGGV